MRAKMFMAAIVAVIATTANLFAAAPSKTGRLDDYGETAPQSERSDGYGKASSNTCGDVNGDGLINIADVVFMLDFLFTTGPPPASFLAADFDDYELVNMHDVFYHLRNIFFMGPPPVCPPSNLPLHELAMPTESIFLHAHQGFFPYATILPPGQSTYTLKIHLTTDTEIDLANLPISIRIGTEIPEIVDLTWSDPCGGEMLTCMYRGSFDPIRAAVNLGFYSMQPDQNMMPGTYPVMNVELAVPSEVEVWRPVYIQLDSLQPAQGGRYVHQPWVTTPGEEILRPTVFRYPCPGMRGNIDGDDLDDVNISDLTYLVSYMFGTPPGPPPLSFEEADVDASVTIDVGDITYFVAYMFQNGPPPVDCPPEE